jgi:hypothetical protein
MAAIFHHALEVNMRLSAGSSENIATAWPSLDVMLQAFVGQGRQHETEITRLEDAKVIELNAAMKFATKELTDAKATIRSLGAQIAADDAKAIELQEAVEFVIEEFKDTEATIQSLRAQITKLEDAAIAANDAKATELKTAVEFATKELINTKATEVETAISTAETSIIEASRKHMIELVAFETVLKHFFERETRKWAVLDMKTSIDTASKVLMGLIGTNVDTSARLCGASTSDLKILQQHANELVKLTRIPTSMDMAQLVGDTSEALLLRPSLTPAATGPRNVASTQTRLPREDTWPFDRYASRNSGQSSQLARSYEVIGPTTTSPEVVDLVSLIKRGYRRQYNSKDHRDAVSASIGGGHAIMFYQLYATMLKARTCADETTKMRLIAICIVDIHDGTLQHEDEEAIKSALARHSRAEISDFNSK